MRKLYLSICVVMFAFAVSCSAESFEPLQVPVAEQSKEQTITIAGYPVKLGNKDPYIVVMRKGVEVQVNLEKLDPEEIEWINVYKGDAANKFGEKGKNGVIVLHLSR